MVPPSVDFRSPQQSRNHSKSDATYVSQLVKWLMFGFNFAFWIAGGVLISVGLWAYVVKNEDSAGQSTSIDSFFDLVLTPSILIMVLGLFIFIIGFAGCTGALRENTVLLRIFSWSLLVIFILQCLLGIIGLALTSVIEDAIKNSLSQNVIERYREDSDLQNLIDYLQTKFRCCGVSSEGYKDWSNNRYFNCTPTNPSQERCGVPYSCCTNPNNVDDNLINTACGNNVQEKPHLELQERIFVTGCVDAIQEEAKANLFVVGGVVLGIAIPQLAGIFLAKTLIRQIEQQKARWKYDS